jgi:tRNA (adenine57-N1/adenine58-N1)-methyltransferase
MLYFDERRKWVLKAEIGREFHTDKGIVKLGDLLGKRFGEAISSSLGYSFKILRPTTFDLVMNVARPTQIMYPKDIGLIILKLGLSCGSRVIEAGTGSGAMTIAAASVVKPHGHIFTYEANPEFARIAKQNLMRAGLISYVTIKNKDARTGFDESEVDAVIIDLGDPWDVIPSAYASLAGGAPLVSFSPTINQVERTVISLRENNFVNVSTVEVILRPLRVEPGRTRPTTTMIGHTGYLTFAQKSFSAT